MQLYEKLAWLRREKGISQLTAAEALKVSRQAISRWEVGTAVPTTDNLKYLSELYGVPVDVLLDDSQDIHTWRESQQSGPAESDHEEHGSQGKPAEKKRIAAILALVLAIGIGVGIMIGAIIFSKEETKDFIEIDDMEQEKLPETNDIMKFSFSW